jgi:hypothetical protein
MSIFIATININGLRDDKKRRTFIDWLISKKINVICVQETHCEYMHFFSKTPICRIWINISNKSFSNPTIIWTIHVCYYIIFIFVFNSHDNIRPKSSELITLTVASISYNT